MADRNGPYSGMHEEVAAVCHNGGLPGCVSRPGCSEPRCRGSGFGPGQTEKWPQGQTEGSHEEGPPACASEAKGNVAGGIHGG